MSTLELKLQLINWLTDLKDKKLLTSLSSIKDSEQSNDWYKQLSAKQKKSFDRGTDDHKKGRTLTSKQFWQRYEK